MSIMGCQIPSRRPRRAPAGSNGKPVVRITREAYNAIADLAADTGRSLFDITSRLLSYALSEVEILYPGEDDE